MDTRKGYVDKLRDTLTAWQKETLDKALEKPAIVGGPGGRVEADRRATNRPSRPRLVSGRQTTRAA